MGCVTNFVTSGARKSASSVPSASTKSIVRVRSLLCCWC
jgi:hypothetical protein